MEFGDWSSRRLQVSVQGIEAGEERVRLESDDHQPAQAPQPGVARWLVPRQRRAAACVQVHAQALAEPRLGGGIGPHHSDLLKVHIYMYINIYSIKIIKFTYIFFKI